MRWIVLLALVFMALSLAGCPHGSKVKPDAASDAATEALKLAQSATPPELGQAKLMLEFTKAEPGTGGKLVNLGFKVADEVGNSASLTLADPKKPQGGEIKADGWRYKFTPRIAQNGVTNEKLHKAFLRGYYCVDVYNPDGQKVGHFDILNTGNLMSKGQCDVAGASIETLAYGKRSVVLIWDAAAPDGTRPVLLGLEWQPAEYPGQRDVAAGDGWNYATHYPQGTLHAYQPTQLRDWPEQFRLLAQSELEESAAYHEQRMQELTAPPKSCGG
jgi:hypothetical protein